MRKKLEILKAGIFPNLWQTHASFVQAINSKHKSTYLCLWIYSMQIIDSKEGLK